MAKHLHIVSFDVPYPVDYGGIIDVFSTIKLLHQAGILIHLHCFEYGRGRQPELNKYCEEVQYYSRRTNLQTLSAGDPYIVKSRDNHALYENLLRDDYPILIEGIHCTSLLFDPRFQKRKVLVRVFNIEHAYYEQLYKSSSSPIRKVYYYLESRLLRRYEKRIASRSTFVTYTEEDAEAFRSHTGATNVHHLPPLVPFGEVKSEAGSGGFCLYHGNLSVIENEQAVVWLLQRVFSSLQIPFVIAGKNPSRFLERLAHANNNTCLVANPGPHEMQDLIRKAQVNVLPSFNNTGVKLKILNALFNGRHCLINRAAAEGTKLEHICHLAASPKEFEEKLTALFRQPFTQEDLESRKQAVDLYFNNDKNLHQLIRWLW